MLPWLQQQKGNGDKKKKKNRKSVLFVKGHINTCNTVLVF